MVRCYLWLFSLYVNIKIGKIIIVRLAGDHLCGKLLFSRLSPDDGAFLCCPFPHEMSWMRS